MAYLILSTEGHEWDRRELRGPIVLGRSPDCDISVHDILLSRRHCRITPSSDGWLLIDLASRNGTLVRDQTVEQCKLKHGDVIRAGKTKITFRADAFMPQSQKSARPVQPPAIVREQQLAGTVDGMRVDLPPAAAIRPSMHRPSPKPQPLDPISFASDNLYSMLEQIASSSWDSIYATNSQPLRRNRSLPQPILTGSNRRISVPPQARPLVVSLSLQAMPTPYRVMIRPTSLRKRTWTRLSHLLSRIGRRERNHRFTLMHTDVAK